MTDVRSDIEDDDYDAFAVFDEAVGVGQVGYIHPTFHDLRSECPVHTGSFVARFGITNMLE